MNYLRKRTEPGTQRAGWAGEEVGDVGAGGCKLLNREWINNGVLLCSMGGAVFNTLG